MICVYQPSGRLLDLMRARAGDSARASAPGDWMVICGESTSAIGNEYSAHRSSDMQEERISSGGSNPTVARYLIISVDGGVLRTMQESSMGSMG